MASLVTVEEFEDYESGDAETFLSAASAAAQRYCGWHIAPSTAETLTVDGRGGTRLWLPSLHVTDVVSVTSDGVLLDEDAYDWSVSGFVQLRKGCFSQRPQGVSVAVEHGYTETPEELAGVIMAAASRAAASPNAAYLQRAGAVQMQWKAGSGSPVGGQFFADERSVLNLYKLPPRQ